MIIKNHLRPSTIRTNSRFRGPTELGKYTNFILEAVHDMKHLGTVLDRNDFIVGHKGQTDFIQDNLAAYLNSEAPVTSYIDTATTLYHPFAHAIEDIDLMSPAWMVYGGCTKTLSGDATRLSTTGLASPSGIAIVQNVEEGNILYIRMKVKYISGDHTSFSIGSSNINQGEGNQEKFEIPENGSTIYIDKRLHCLHREPISINIDVQHSPDALEPTVIEVSNVEIKYMTENELKLTPINTTIKSKVNSLEDRLKNIINNI